MTGPPLGEGATAVVWPARHRIDGSDVALKVWKAPLVTERDRDRFLREARQHREIAERSPYLVRYVTSGLRDRRYPWIATGRHGTALDRVLEDGGRPALPEGAVVAHDILAGLAAVHRAGSVHRDVKPGNVLVDRGRARLGDLGLVMRADAFTQDAQAGTPRYVAPELVRPGSAPTARTDVYSAAATIREVLPDELPAALGGLLSAGTGPPDARPADGQEFLERFAAACQEAGLDVAGLPDPADAGPAPGRHPNPPLLPDDEPGPGIRRPVVIAAASLAAAAAVVVAALLVQGPGDRPQAPDEARTSAPPAQPSGPPASPGSGGSSPPAGTGLPVFATADEAVAAVLAAVPDPRVPARGAATGECEPGGGMSRHDVVEHVRPGSAPPVLLAGSETTWMPGTGEACVRLVKSVDGPLWGRPTWLALTVCGGPGRCDSDRSAFVEYAGPLRTQTPNGCYAWAVAVSESENGPFAVQSTHHSGCAA